MRDHLKNLIIQNTEVAINDMYEENPEVNGIFEAQMIINTINESNNAHKETLVSKRGELNLEKSKIIEIVDEAINQILTRYSDRINQLSESSFEEMMRNGTGSPGATSRTITDNYYSNIEENEIRKLYHILSDRNKVYRSLGKGMRNRILMNIIEEYNYDLTLIILCMSYYENIHEENLRSKFKDKLELIYRIIVEGHNKICPYKDRKNFRIPKYDLYIPLLFLEKNLE